MNLKSVWVPVVFIALIVLLAVGLQLNPREVPSPLVGKRAPDFELALLREPDKRFSRKDMLGEVWVLNVWASWCPPCLAEHPVITALAKEGTPVVGLNYKDEREDALAWLARNGDPFRVTVFDPAGDIAIDYGVYGVPETYLIDRKGVIRYKHIGPLTAEVVRQKLRPLLEELRSGV